MKKDVLFEAIGDIDENFIEEATLPYKKKTLHIGWQKTLGLCACLVILVTAVIISMQSGIFDIGLDFIAGNSQQNNSAGFDSAPGQNGTNIESEDSSSRPNFGASDNDNSDSDISDTPNDSDDNPSTEGPRPFDYILKVGDPFTAEGLTVKLMSLGDGKIEIYYDSPVGSKIGLLSIFRDNGLKCFSAYGDVSAYGSKYTDLTNGAIPSGISINASIEDITIDRGCYSCTFDISGIYFSTVVTDAEYYLLINGNIVKLQSE